MIETQQRLMDKFASALRLAGMEINEVERRHDSDQALLGVKHEDTMDLRRLHRTSDLNEGSIGPNRDHITLHDLLDLDPPEGREPEGSLGNSLPSVGIRVKVLAPGVSVISQYFLVVGQDVGSRDDSHAPIIRSDHR